MEILNNIWMAISTPNEGLLNLITIPLYFVENYLIMTLFISILNVSVTRKQKVIYSFIIPVISIISMYVLESPLNIIFNYFSMIILAHVIFKISIFKSCISIVISALIFNLIGSITLNPYITCLDITSEQLSTIPIYRLSYISIVYILIGLVVIFLKSKKLIISFSDIIDKKSKLILFANVLLGIIALIAQTIIDVCYIDVLPLVITILSGLPLLAYFILSIYSLTRTFKLMQTTQKLESAEEYNNTLRVLHDSVRSFKHDFDNIVTTIGGYVRTNDMEGLKNYYVQLEDDCQRVNNLYILNPDIVNNDGIYNLLTKKYSEADSKDIKMNITFLLDLSNLNMKIYEFARILGILLDNAIEASNECEEKIINLTFRDDSKRSRQLIIIENTYKNKEVDTEKIFEKGFSEKENHTGLGLWEVRKIVKKNNNISLYTTKDDKFFKQQLEIYY